MIEVEVIGEEDGVITLFHKCCAEDGPFYIGNLANVLDSIWLAKNQSITIRIKDEETCKT